MVLIGLFQA